MDALTLLEKQHREVEELFKKAKKASGSQKESLFIQIADALATHTSIEEKIFYPAALAKETEDVLLEALQEHLQAKRLLADMLDMDGSDPRFDAKLTVLEEEGKHHVEEEEDDMFKKVRKLMDKEELQNLGVEMMNAVEMLKDSEPHTEIPNETDEAAPLQ